MTTVVWPPTLKVLILRERFAHPIGEADGDEFLLPDGPEELHPSSEFYRSIGNFRLPVGVKHLTTMEGKFSIFDQGLAGVIWPPGLEELNLGGRFNQPMESTAFPATLRELSFGWDFAYSLQGVALCCDVRPLEGIAASAGPVCNNWDF